MILKSFLAGFAAYVLAVIYNLLQGNSLKFVFINGIKFLFIITLFVLVFQIILFYFKSNSDSKFEAEETNSSPESQNKDKNEKADTVENHQATDDFTSDQFSEDFSSFNPPEIEYEQQNKE